MILALPPYQSPVQQRSLPVLTVAVFAVLLVLLDVDILPQFRVEQDHFSALYDPYDSDRTRFLRTSRRRHVPVGSAFFLASLLVLPLAPFH